MVKKYAILFFLFISFLNFGQTNTPPPPACKLFSVIDDNNDGYAEFDTNYYIGVYVRDLALAEHGYNLAEYVLDLYPSETDYNNNTNRIGLTYTNTVQNSQYCYLKFTYMGSGTAP
jgi:hypothetical protein